MLLVKLSLNDCHLLGCFGVWSCRSPESNAVDFSEFFKNLSKVSFRHVSKKISNKNCSPIFLFITDSLLEVFISNLEM